MVLQIQFISRLSDHSVATDRYAQCKPSWSRCSSWTRLLTCPLLCRCRNGPDSASTLWGCRSRSFTPFFAPRPCGRSAPIFQPSSAHSCECSRAPGVRESPLPCDSEHTCIMRSLRSVDIHIASTSICVRNKKKNNNQQSTTNQQPTNNHTNNQLPTAYRLPPTNYLPPTTQHTTIIQPGEVPFFTRRGTSTPL